MAKSKNKLSLLEQALAVKKQRETTNLRQLVIDKKITRAEAVQRLLPNYIMQPKPKAFHNSTKPDKYIVGGYGSGKTYSFCAEAIFLGYMNCPLPILLIIQTKSNSEATTESTLEEICKANDLQCWSQRDDGGTYLMFYVKFAEDETAVFYLASGKVPDNLASITMAAVGVDEPFLQSQKTRDQAVARARHPKAVINEAFFAGTIEPEKMDWGFEIVDESFKGDKHTFKVVIPTSENKFATKQYIDRMKRMYSEANQKVYLEGRNVQLGGSFVYTGLSDKNVMPAGKLKMPKGYIQLGLGFDFNVGKMTAAEFWLDGKIRRQVADHWIHNSNTEELCALIIERMNAKYPGITGKNKLNYSLLIAMDAAARQRKSSAKLGSTDATIIRDMFIAAGFNVTIHIPLENPAVRDRVNFVNKLAETDRYIIYDNCKETLLDRKYVKYKEGSEGFAIDKRNGRSHMSEAGDYYLYTTRMIIENNENEDHQSITIERRSERV